MTVYFKPSANPTVERIEISLTELMRATRAVWGKKAYPAFTVQSLLTQLGVTIDYTK